MEAAVAATMRALGSEACVPEVTHLLHFVVSTNPETGHT